MLGLEGQTIGRLTVLYEGERRGKRRRWWCWCACGSVYLADQTHMRGGRVKSCGCRQREQLATIHRTHGREHTVEYSTWRGMKSRCNNPNCAAYPSYGGRGIRVALE